MSIGSQDDSGQSNAPAAPETVVPKHRGWSVKTVAYASATLIITLFLIVSAVNLSLAKAYYRPADDQGINERLEGKVQGLEAQLGFFHQIINNVAAQPTTQDLLEFGDATNAQLWALQLRRFLPQAIGVALLDNYGKVLGEPASQRLGPLCLTDLAKLSQGQHIHNPPVHREIPQLAHFDLTTKVYDDTDSPLGVLFVSFGLDTLQNLLKTYTDAGQTLILRDGDGDVIAETGHTSVDHPAISAVQHIPDSDWTLQLREPPPSDTASFLSLVIFNISALLLTVGTVILLVSKYTRLVDGSFRQLQGHVERLASGQVESLPTAPQLKEAAEIFPALTDIQQNLNQQRRQLENQTRTDPVTGLANQRQFNIDFARAYDLARRDMPVCVVMLRLDGLDKLPEETSKSAIKLLTKSLLQVSRKVDQVARLDDDRFAMLLFGMKPQGCEPFLQRLLESFATEQDRHPAIPGTAGCLLYGGHTLIHRHRDNDPGEVLARAERALAQAGAEQPLVAL